MIGISLKKYLGWYSFNREAHKAARKQCRTEGFATVKTAGYDEYYLVPTGSIQISDETGLPIDDGAAADMKKRSVADDVCQESEKEVWKSDYGKSYDGLDCIELFRCI